MPVPETFFEDYFQALLAGDSDRCFSIIQTWLSQEGTILEIYEELFQRSLYQVGDLWSKGLLTVADEHIATAMTERLMAQLQAVMIKAESNRKRVLVSCITSDYHQIGARMAANLFELHGWESYYLGANLPIPDLLKAIERIQPAVTALSLVLRDQLKVLELTLGEIRTKHPQLPVIVGGRAFTGLESDPLEIGPLPQVYILKSISELEHLIASFG